VAFCLVGLHHQADAELRSFAERTRGWPLVRDAWMVSGESDFLLHCVASDLGAFQTFVIEQLTSTPNVDTVRTALTIRRVKDEGLVSFYRGTGPTRVDFPLDLDLASPMMAGCILATQGEPRSLLPLGSTLVGRGPRAEAAASGKERGTAPASLHLVAGIVGDQLSVDQAIERLVSYHPRNEARIITSKEACAALVTAQALGWICWIS
jgi:hypothetical protein